MEIPGNSWMQVVGCTSRFVQSTIFIDSSRFNHTFAGQTLLIPNFREANFSQHLETFANDLGREKDLGESRIDFNMMAKRRFCSIGIRREDMILWLCKLQGRRGFQRKKLTNMKCFGRCFTRNFIRGFMSCCIFFSWSILKTPFCFVAVLLAVTYYRRGTAKWFDAPSGSL